MKDIVFDIIFLNDNVVLVEGKLYKKNEVVKIIYMDIEGVVFIFVDFLFYGNFCIVESEVLNGYLIDGVKLIDFVIIENEKIMDLIDEVYFIYN